MFNFIKNKKSLWIPALIIILLTVIMLLLSKYGINPLGYTIY